MRLADRLMVFSIQVFGIILIGVPVAVYYSVYNRVQLWRLRRVVMGKGSARLRERIFGPTKPETP